MISIVKEKRLFKSSINSGNDMGTMTTMSHQIEKKIVVERIGAVIPRNFFKGRKNA